MVEASATSMLPASRSAAMRKLIRRMASTTKVYGSEGVIEILRRLMDIVGSSALVRSGSSAAFLMGELEYEIRSWPINTFGGGTNEIQRELIAQFGLGMPRPVR